MLALVAARMDHRTGRSWRPLQDAADEASLLYDARPDWGSYRRGVDFYDEGELIWLEADVTIRKMTKEEKSLDDFCRLFYGPPSSGPVMIPYTFEDVVTALNKIVNYDWRSFFTTRLESLGPGAPLGGIQGGGWKLVYRDNPLPVQKAVEVARKTIDVSYSLGFQVNEDSSIGDVIQGSPAAEAGIIPTMKLIAVNGRGYTREILRSAIREAMKDPAPIRVLTESGGYYSTFNMDYHEGERYPALERDESNPDVLSQIIRPLGK
jgi:predicted metalloprotease with PDZ domain